MLPRLLPLCLAAAFLSAGPIMAQSAPQTIVLQHTVPGELLKSLHWDNAKELPAGVTQITALPTTNALSIVATPDGFAQVREIVTLADVAPRQVKIEFALVDMTDAELKESGIRLTQAAHDPTGYATGIPVLELRQKLEKNGRPVETLRATLTSNVDGTFDFHADKPLPPLPTMPNIEAFTYGITPRVNGNGTITLMLHPHATWRVAGADGKPASKTEGLYVTRTVQSGDTLLIAKLFEGAAGLFMGVDSHLLLFVTPTALPK